MFALADYAAKPWAGLVSDYYVPLWNHFMESLRNATQHGGPPNAETLQNELTLLGEAWINSTSPTYPSNTSGVPSLSLAAHLLEKWVP